MTIARFHVLTCTSLHSIVTPKRRLLKTIRNYVERTKNALNYRSRKIQQFWKRTIAIARNQERRVVQCQPKSRFTKRIMSSNISFIILQLLSPAICTASRLPDKIQQIGKTDAVAKSPVCVESVFRGPKRMVRMQLPMKMDGNIIVT